MTSGKPEGQSEADHKENRGTLGTDPKLFADLASTDPIMREKAWRRFERMYTPLLISWARHLGHRGQDVEDLVQDVKAVFLAKAKTFEYDPGLRFRGLLKRILENKGSELARSRRRHRGGAQLTDDMVEALAADFDLDSAWQIEALREAISVVRKDYQTNPRKNILTFRAFELRVLEGLSGEAAAASLGVNRSMVDTYKGRVAREVSEAVKRIAELYG